MRSNDSLRRLGANFVKMLVLVMCFATVFAIVMTADLSGIGTDSAGNVAEAGTAGTKSAYNITNEDWSRTSGQDMSAIQQSLHSSGAQTITMTATLPIDSTLQDYAGMWSDEHTPTVWNGGTDNGNGFSGYVQLISGTGANRLCVSVNIALPEVVVAALDAKYSVSVGWTATVTNKADCVTSRPKCGMGINQSVRTQGLSDLYSQAGDRKEQTGDGTWTMTSTVSINASNRYIQLVLFTNEPWTGEDPAIRAANNILTFTIKKTDSAMDYSDGTAPKYTGEWAANIFGEKTFADSNSADFAPYRSGNVGANSSSINLNTVATATNGFSVNGTTYAKKLTLNLEDGDDTSSKYYTGLASVTIQKDGDAQKTIDTQYGTTGTASDTDWYASYTVEAARDTGTLTLYFKANGTYNITVSDTGGLPLVHRRNTSARTAGIYTGSLKNRRNRCHSAVRLRRAARICPWCGLSMWHTTRTLSLPRPKINLQTFPRGQGSPLAQVRS